MEKAKGGESEKEEKNETRLERKGGERGREKGNHSDKNEILLSLSLTD